MGKRVLRPKRPAGPPGNARSDVAADGGRGLAGAAVTAGVARIGTIGKESVMSRGKRKRFEKREHVQRKNAFIEDELARLEAAAVVRRNALASSGAQRRKDTTPVLTSMSALADAVDAVGRAEQAVDTEGKAERPAQKVVHEKARRRILADESVQVQNVIEHPSFQADPMEALRQHLMNTVGEDPLAVPAALDTGVKKPRRRKPANTARHVVGPVPLSSRGRSQTAVEAEDAAQRRTDKAQLDVQMRSKVKKAAAVLAGPGRVQKPGRGRIGEKRPKI
jgi:hypothetical protein